MKRILDITPDDYIRHPIHTQERDWAETNCYADVWIEQLHALGHDPIAAMPFTLGIDFEGDQWTFFKFHLSDIYKLYGIDVQELAIWQPLVKHVENQISLGRPVLVELDSMYLPDTVGTAYKEAHVKTTVAVNTIDINNKYMEYFHGQSYYKLEGSDFDAVFRMDNTDRSRLEPYVEIAKLSNNKPIAETQLVITSLNILKEKLQLIPNDNPFEKFKSQFIKDLDWLKQSGLETFHDYSFATFRQYGACFELSAVYLDWLQQHGETGLEEAIHHFKQVSELTKVYQFQLARAVMRNKDVDFATLDSISQHWQDAVSILVNKYSH